MFSIAILTGAANQRIDSLFHSQVPELNRQSESIRLADYELMRMTAFQESAVTLLAIITNILSSSRLSLENKGSNHKPNPTLSET